MISYEDWIQIPNVTYETVKPQSGIGLSLSGGGFKAALYHLGAIIRLNEFGLLKNLEIISCVSGGAIVGAWLGLVWDKLEIDPNTGNFNSDSLRNEFVTPIFELITEHTIGAIAFIRGLLPLKSRAQELSAGYAKHLFGDARLNDISSESSAPKFVFTSTCARTNRPWRFSRECVECDYIGRILYPEFTIADVVAASSAVPLVLDSLVLDFSNSVWDETISAPFDNAAFKANAILRDGALIDNLGLDPIISTCHSVLVSDAGSIFSLQKKPKLVGLNFMRAVSALMEHGESSRVLRLYEMAKREEKQVLFWRLRQNPQHFDIQILPQLSTKDVHAVITAQMTLNRYGVELAQMIINHGYAMCGLVFENYGNSLHQGQSSNELPFTS